jgi:hypothetical protein
MSVGFKTLFLHADAAVFHFAAPTLSILQIR